MSNTFVDPRTAGSPTPTHQRSWRQIRKGPYNRYLSGGTAANITVTTPPGQAHTATLTIQGSITVDTDSGVCLPSTVTAILTQASATKATQVAPVNATGGYTTTFPANVLAAGTATATVSSVTPAETTTTPAFTMT